MISKKLGNLSTATFIFLLSSILFDFVSSVPTSPANRTTEISGKIVDSKDRQNRPCNVNQFECNDGMCINKNFVCDGARDCRDGSDESRILCSSTNAVKTVTERNPARGSEENQRLGSPTTPVPRVACRVGQFSCMSGECINMDLTCNGRNDCRDGSDESSSICSNITDKLPPKSQPSRWANGSSIGERGTGTPCPVPDQPANGRWKLHRSLCESGRGCDAPSDLKTMWPGTHLVYTCDDGFLMNGTSHVLCALTGNWIYEPKCDAVKCKVLCSSKMEAVCSLNGRSTSCDVPAPVGTVAQLKCRNGFAQKLPNSSARSTVTCQHDGTWSPDAIECTKLPKKVKLVLMGDLSIGV